MKKALVVFLILAVAGGLFAQVTFSGAVNTGIGIGFDNQDDGASPLVNYIRDRGNNGIRAEINASYSGEGDYGKYGAQAKLAAQADRFSGGPGFEAANYNLWWQPNSLLKLHFGTDGGYDFGLPGGLGENFIRDWHQGLKILVTPGGGLSIGSQIFYGQNQDGRSSLDKLAYGIGVKYGLDILDIVALAKLDTKADDSRPDTNGLNFGAGVNLKLIPGLPIGLDVAGYNFLYSKTNYIGVGEKISYNIGALSLGLTAQEFFGLGDDLEAFIPLLFQATLSYKASDVVSFGIEGRYVMGKAPNYNYRNASEVAGLGDGIASVFVKDNKKAALGVSPSVTFKVGPEIKLGYNLQMDMTDGVKATEEVKTMQHLIYAMFNLSF